MRAVGFKNEPSVCSVVQVSPGRTKFTTLTIVFGVVVFPDVPLPVKIPAQASLIVLLFTTLLLPVPPQESSRWIAASVLLFITLDVNVFPLPHTSIPSKIRVPITLFPFTTSLLSPM